MLSRTLDQKDGPFLLLKWNNDGTAHAGWPPCSLVSLALPFPHPSFVAFFVYNFILSALLPFSLDPENKKLEHSSLWYYPHEIHVLQTKLWSTVYTCSWIAQLVPTTHLVDVLCRIPIVTMSCYWSAGIIYTLVYSVNKNECEEMAMYTPIRILSPSWVALATVKSDRSNSLFSNAACFGSTLATLKKVLLHRSHWKSPTLHFAKFGSPHPLPQNDSTPTDQIKKGNAILSPPHQNHPMK
jgi:hypothetical protein